MSLLVVGRSSRPATRRSAGMSAKRPSMEATPILLSIDWRSASEWGRKRKGPVLGLERSVRNEKRGPRPEGHGPRRKPADGTARRTGAKGAAGERRGKLAHLAKEAIDLLLGLAVAI